MHSAVGFSLHLKHIFANWYFIEKSVIVFYHEIYFFLNSKKIVQITLQVNQTWENIIKVSMDLLYY